MEQNRNISWDIFSNIFIVLLIAGFIYLVYATLGTGPGSFLPIHIEIYFYCFNPPFFCFFRTARASCKFMVL